MKKSNCLLIMLSLIFFQEAFAQSTEEPKTNVFFIAIYNLNDWIIYGEGTHQSIT